MNYLLKISQEIGLASCVSIIVGSVISAVDYNGLVFIINGQYEASE